MPYRRLLVINVEIINLLTQIPNRFYVIKELPETMITTIYLFSFLGSVRRESDLSLCRVQKYYTTAETIAI